MSLKFEWDYRKALENANKHGITFEEATTVFGDLLSMTIPDPLHSLGEERFITIGHAPNGKTLVVAHTDRGDKIRIVSARIASKGEKKTYEED